LICLCAKSCAARMAWKDAGCPSRGPLYEEKDCVEQLEEEFSFVPHGQRG